MIYWGTDKFVVVVVVYNIFRVLAKFMAEKAFLRWKKMKIQDFFSDVPCKILLPAQHFFELLGAENWTGQG